jgi:hypothetical protein
MKKLLMATLLLVAFSGITMAQVSPAKKHPQTKSANVNKSDSTATTTGVHKMSKKKTHTKHS